MSETSETAPVTAGCHYEIAGEFCGQPVRARGYCKRHYAAMSRRGAFDPERPLSLSPAAAPVTAAQVDRNIGHLDRARLLLQQHAEDLVGILLEAARKAAKRGDSKPAEWALLHSRTLEPVLTGGAATRPNGKDDGDRVRVIIGVQLSQVPSTSTQVLAGQLPGGQANSLQPAATATATATAEIAGLPDRVASLLPPLDAVIVEPAE